MPIEIRELVVRARIDPEGDRSQETAIGRSTDSRVEEESITRACVQEVLRILESKRER